MSRWLKQSTAATVLVGPFLDATDGVTEESGLASNGTEISKNGGAFAAGPTLGTHDSDGWYPISLTTTHTNTLGALVVKSHDNTTHLPVWHEFMVVPANVYDSLVGGSDTLEVDATLIEGTDATDQINAACDTALTDYDAVVPADLPTNFGDLSITATTGLVDITQAAADKAWSTTTRVLTANTNLNDPTAASIADAVWDEAKAGHVGAGSFGEEVQAHALTSEVSAVETDTQDIQSRLPAALVSGRIDASVGAMGAGVLDAAALADDAGHEIADQILARNIAGGSDGGRDVTSALRRIRNRIAISGGTMTVYQENDTTSAWTGAVTTTAGDPVSEVDPA